MKILFLLLLYGVLNQVEGLRPKYPRCLDRSRIAWRLDARPYTKIANDSRHVGIVEQIFFKAMDNCCEGHPHYNFTLNFTSQADIPDILMDEKTKNEFDFIYPVQSDAKSKSFLIFPFVPLVVSPGMAVFVKPSKEGAEAILKSVESMAPFMSLILIFMSIAGCIFWMIETFVLAWRGEPVEHFWDGFIDGVWWAFVTMTTVGYGDKIPKTAGGRIFSVFWVIGGLVFCGICVSNLTSGILVSISKTDVEIMNAEVAVLKASEEYKYASKKQGIIYEFDTVKEVVAALRAGNVTIALLDTMVAGSYKELLEDFSLNRVIETMNSNGVIFVNNGSKFSKCFREYIMDRQQEVLDLVSKNVRTVQYTSFEDKAILINPELPMFRIGILAMLGTLLSFIIIGVTYDWACNYLKKRKLEKKMEGIDPLLFKRQEKQRQEVLKSFNDIVEICNFFIRNLENEEENI